MAGSILIPLKAVFDDKGIKDASKQFKNLGGLVKGALGAVGVGVSLASIVSGLQESAKAAVSDAKSQAILANSLRNVTGASDEVIASVESQIAKMSLATGVVDDQLRPAFQSLVTATGSVTKAQSLMGLAMDVAADKQISVEEASKMLGKAINGTTKGLFAMYPNLKNSSNWMEQLATNTDGMAEAAANTDPITRINTIFGELQETIGVALIPSLQAFASWLASPSTQAALKYMIDGFNAWVTSMKNVVDGANYVGMALVNVLNIDPNAAGKAWNGFFNGLGDSIARLALGPLGPALLKILGIVGKATAAQTAFKPIEFVPTDFSELDFGTGKITKALDDTKDAAKKALDKLKEEFKKFKQELKDTSATWEPMALVTREIGKYESQIGDYFDNITAKIKEGVKAGTIANNKGTKDLLAYVATEKKALEAIGQQRDALTEKRSLAEALYDDVKAAITGVGSLTNLLDTEGKSVTTTVTKIINGLSVATSQTVEQAMGAKGYLGRLKDILANTKAFAKQLVELKKLGLDKDLFKQIVDAGPEVGGQLATEILSGGEDSVKALNTTFGELQTVAAAVAEDTATVMFNSGVTMAGGLIAGLKSQEQLLIDQANKMAASFKAAFDLAAGNLSMGTGIPNTDVQSLRLGDIKLAGEKAGASAVDKANAKLAAQLINTKQYTAFGATSVINLTVNAGAGTNGKQLGTFLKSEVARVTKAGG